MKGAGNRLALLNSFHCLEVLSIQFHVKRMLEAKRSGGAHSFIPYLTLKAGCSPPGSPHHFGTPLAFLLFQISRTASPKPPRIGMGRPRHAKYPRFLLLQICRPRSWRTSKPCHKPQNTRRIFTV